MLGYAVLLFAVIGLSLHVKQFAPQRGRSGALWLLLLLAGGGVGCGLGSIALAALVASESTPAPLVMILNPVILGLVGALAVTVALHTLPVAAAELRGDAWQFDRLDTEQRVSLRLSDTIMLDADGTQLEIDPDELDAVNVDGECVVLALGKDAERKSIALRPVGLPTREMRIRFSEAVRDRIQSLR